MLIEYPALAPYGERYDGLVGVPLRVVVTLTAGSRVAGYDPVNLDNLLARAVVDEATEGLGLPDEPCAYRLPVPLQLLWTSDDDLPLWAATQFAPVGDSATDVAYWHKRAQPGRFTKTKSGRFSISATNGRYMERRVPLPTIVCDTWRADAIGDPEEVARLLASISYIGKRRTNGFGEVREWRVEPLESFQLVRDDRLTRPLPAEAVHLLRGVVPDAAPAPIGWTPPEWKPALFRLGWYAGTPCRVDWYEAARVD
jgi:CRISPR type IV-associated protein Csf3